MASTTRISDRLPAALIAKLEAWHLAQPVPPTKIGALAYLVERGLAADAAAGRPPQPRKRDR